METPRNCPDCGVKPGETHEAGCDVERCMQCGGQRISCFCAPARKKWIEREKWTGIWPGHKECEEFGWFAIFVPGEGWKPCSKDTPGAQHDLNRLEKDCNWSPAGRTWVRRDR